MIMMLPFLLALLSVWCILRGRRGAGIAFWTLTLLVFAAWCQYHMTDALGLSL